MLPKPILRRALRQCRDTLSDRDIRSAAICARIGQMSAYTAAHVIHCYLPIRSEVDTRPLIVAALSQGKDVVVPVIAPGSDEMSHAWLESLAAEDLEQGGFGTFQPRNLRSADSSAWDLVIVPLLGFDRRGYRLGYGKGHYDRLLAVTSAPTIGVAFATQEVAALPNEAHDIPLGWIVTEDEVIQVMDVPG